MHIQTRIKQMRPPGWGNLTAFLRKSRQGDLREGYAVCRDGHLSYKFYLPKRLARKPALVMMLHGCRQNAEDFAQGTGMNRFAERHGFIVAYPQQNLRANMNRCWNWFDRRNQDRSGEAAMIIHIIDELCATYDVDPAAVFVAGLSAGGALTALLGRTYPDRIAAIGIHSGVPAGAASNVHGALGAMKNGDRGATGPGPTRAIIFQGDVDETVAVANGDRIAFDTPQQRGRVRRRPCLRGWRWCRRFLIAPAAENAGAEYWQVRGLGHAWSGGNPAGSYTDRRGPDASGEMVRFFLGYHRMIYPLVVFGLTLMRPFR